MGIQCTFTRDESGSTAPIFALSILAILALVGAAIALSFDARSANNLQATADTAALSGATAFVNSDTPKLEDRLLLAEAAAEEIAIANSDYALTRLGVATQSEDAYGQHTEIEVALEFEPTNPAAHMAGRNANITIERTAKASATWGFPLCTLSLSGSGTGLQTDGNAMLSAQNCLIWTNSMSNTSMSLNGGRVDAKYICSAGGVTNSGTSVSPTPSSSCQQVPDPLESWVSPSHAGSNELDEDEIRDGPRMGNLEQRIEEWAPIARLFSGFVSQRTGMSAEEQVDDGNRILSAMGELDAQNRFIRGPLEGMTVEEVYQMSGLIENVDPSLYANDRYYASATETLTPDTYFGLDIFEGNVRMMPGVYHIVDAPLIVRRRATLDAEGVTIIFHGDRAGFHVLDEARAKIIAPETGETAGFALAENRRASLSELDPVISKLTGNGEIEVIGTIYLPRQIFRISGWGAGQQASPLLQIVAHSIEMADGGMLKIDFDPTKTDVPAAILPERTARLIH